MYEKLNELYYGAGEGDANFSTPSPSTGPTGTPDIVYTGVEFNLKIDGVCKDQVKKCEGDATSCSSYISSISFANYNIVTTPTEAPYSAEGVKITFGNLVQNSDEPINSYNFKLKITPKFGDTTSCVGKQIEKEITVRQTAVLDTEKTKVNYENDFTYGWAGDTVSLSYGFAYYPYNSTTYFTYNAAVTSYYIDGSYYKLSTSNNPSYFGTDGVILSTYNNISLKADSYYGNTISNTLNLRNPITQWSFDSSMDVIPSGDTYTLTLKVGDERQFKYSGLNTNAYITAYNVTKLTQEAESTVYFINGCFVANGVTSTGIDFKTYFPYNKDELAKTLKVIVNEAAYIQLGTDSSLAAGDVEVNSGGVATFYGQLMNTTTTQTQCTVTVDESTPGCNIELVNGSGEPVNNVVLTNNAASEIHVRCYDTNNGTYKLNVSDIPGYPISPGSIQLVVEDMDVNLEEVLSTQPPTTTPAS